MLYLLINQPKANWVNDNGNKKQNIDSDFDPWMYDEWTVKISRLVHRFLLTAVVKLLVAC